MEDLFLRVLDLSVTASWVILAVLAVRMLLRKAPKVYSYALWAVVGFRLVSSASVRSLLSLFNLSAFRKVTLATGELRFVPRDISTAEIPHIDTGIPVVDTVVNDYLPAATPEASVNPMQIVIFAGMIIWLVGMIVMAAVSIVNYIRLRRGLRFAVRKKGNIWQCETVRSPFLVGVISPRIYLPYGLDDQTESYILAHEKYHLRRFDHIVKLVAYALLTVHWFNPLCHLAFRLMNRDMEMSCDEHVLNRNDIPTTQYSLSLLTIATNRRYPAATPLAFAETGVKERMINVLNWKKPKKWVTAVAVIVCVILLISCATNPKWTEPKVDDPAMLEFPGLKWNATPEEVKENLGLKTKQILVDKQVERSEYMDTWVLSAAEVPVFGEEVVQVQFHFVRYTGYDQFGLDTVRVYYPDEVDMSVIRDAMIDTYGEGNGKGITRYRVSNNTVVSGIESRLQTNTTDALAYYWVNSCKGTDVLSKEVQEAVVALHTADREVVLESLDKNPLVTLFCTDSADVGNPSDDDLFTCNHVEFSAGIYIDLIQRFGNGATNPQVSGPAVGNPALLEFPGLKWGMTPEGAKAALNITDDMITEEKTYGDELRITLSGSRYFGADAESVTLRFYQYSDKSALWNVQVTYAPGTDMAAVRDNLIDIYGPGTDHGFTDYEIFNGSVQSYVNWNHTNEIHPGTTIEDNAKNPNPTDEIYHRWAGTAKGNKLFTDEEIEMIVEAFGNTGGTRTDRETVIEYLDKKVFVTMLCRDGYTNQVGVEYRPCVSLTGGHVSFIKMAAEYADK